MKFIQNTKSIWTSLLENCRSCVPLIYFFGVNIRHYQYGSICPLHVTCKNPIDLILIWDVFSFQRISIICQTANGKINVISKGRDWIINIITNWAHSFMMHFDWFLPLFITIYRNLRPFLAKNRPFLVLKWEVLNFA